MVIKIVKITQSILHFIFGQDNIPCVTIAASMFRTMAFPVAVLHDLVSRMQNYLVFVEVVPNNKAETFRNNFLQKIDSILRKCFARVKCSILTCIPPLFSSVSKNGIHAIRVI